MAGRSFLTCLVLFLTLQGSAQVSFNAGGSMLKSFGPIKPFGGFHLGVEIPRDDAISFYGRYSHYFANTDSDSVPLYLTARDISSLPPGSQISPIINGLPSMNYNIFEGGTRYYLGDGFDFGFGAYGGSTVMLLFNKVRMKYQEYDEELYYIDDTYNYEGSMFFLAFGLQGGIKYTEAPFGTVYLDLGIDYLIFGQTSTNGVYTGMYRPLIFTVNLGYRKDLFW